MKIDSKVMDHIKSNGFLYEKEEVFLGHNHVFFNTEGDILLFESYMDPESGGEVNYVQVKLDGKWVADREETNDIIGIFNKYFKKYIRESKINNLIK